MLNIISHERNAHESRRDDTTLALLVWLLSAKLKSQYWGRGGESGNLVY